MGRGEVRAPGCWWRLVRVLRLCCSSVRGRGLLGRAGTGDPDTSLRGGSARPGSEGEAGGERRGRLEEKSRGWGSSGGVR